MLRWIADRARSALSHRQPLAVLTFGEMRFLNTKIQETKETPWIRVFHFWGTGSYLSCSGGPRSNSSGLLRASQPGAAASVRPSRPENDTLYVFCCAPTSTRLQPRTLRVLPAQGPKEEYQTAKEREHHVVFSFFWDPAATYLSGPSPAKYCRRIRA